MSGSTFMRQQNLTNGVIIKDRAQEDIEMRPSCCSPINSDAVFINFGANGALQAPPPSVSGSDKMLILLRLSENASLKLNWF